MRQMSPVCEMADNGRLNIDQKVKVVLFYAETKSVVATRRRFPAHFGKRWAPCKQTIYRLSWGKIFQPMKINSVPDVKCFYNNKNVLCLQTKVWHFVRHPVYIKMLLGPRYLSIFDKTTPYIIAAAVKNFNHTLVGGDIHGRKHLLPISLVILAY